MLTADDHNQNSDCILLSICILLKLSDDLKQNDWCDAAWQLGSKCVFANEFVDAFL